MGKLNNALKKRSGLFVLLAGILFFILFMAFHSEASAQSYSEIITDQTLKVLYL